MNPLIAALVDDQDRSNSRVVQPNESFQSKASSTTECPFETLSTTRHATDRITTSFALESSPERDIGALATLRC